MSHRKFFFAVFLTASEANEGNAVISANTGIRKVRGSAPRGEIICLKWLPLTRVLQIN